MKLEREDAIYLNQDEDYIQSITVIKLNTYVTKGGGVRVFLSRVQFFHRYFMLLSHSWLCVFGQKSYAMLDNFFPFRQLFKK